jgi:2,3-bisphosphoglycerate-dependent phosphoglycerate mutase
MIKRSYGDLERKFIHKTVIRKYGKRQFDIWHRSYDVPPPGGESIEMVKKRVLAFIEDLIILMKRERVNVAISAHGNSMRPFRKYFEKLTIEQMMKLENPYDKYFDYIVES